MRINFQQFQYYRIYQCNEVKKNITWIRIQTILKMLDPDPMKLICLQNPSMNPIHFATGSEHVLRLFTI
jgi:hypothetical protein